MRKSGLLARRLPRAYNSDLEREFKDVMNGSVDVEFEDKLRTVGYWKNWCSGDWHYPIKPYVVCSIDYCT